MVSCHADPSLMTAQRECRHIKHILKQMYTSHHPMMIHLLASFCSSPPMAWPVLCMQEEGWRTGELPRGGVIKIASVKRRPWHADPAAIVKKRMSTSADCGWIEPPRLRCCDPDSGRLADCYHKTAVYRATRGCRNGVTSKPTARVSGSTV